MSLGPFLAMLMSRALFQSRVDTFEDASEGAFGFKKVRITNKVAAQLSVPPRSYRDDGGEKTVPALTEDVIKAARRHTAITCWFQHTGTESFAMWRIYGRDHFAVAIATTLGALRELFSANANVRIGPVSYTELPAIVDDVYTLFAHKRTEYASEREIRSIQVYPTAILDKFPMATMTPAQMNALLDNIIAAPGMEGVMLESLRRLLHSQFDLSGISFDGGRLRRSDLDTDLIT